MVSTVRLRALGQVASSTWNTVAGYLGIRVSPLPQPRHVNSQMLSGQRIPLASRLSRTRSVRNIIPRRLPPLRSRLMAAHQTACRPGAPRPW